MQNTLNTVYVSSLCTFSVAAIVIVKHKTATIISKTKHIVHKCHKTDKNRMEVTHCLLKMTQFET